MRKSASRTTLLVGPAIAFACGVLATAAGAQSFSTQDRNQQQGTQNQAQQASQAAAASQVSTSATQSGYASPTYRPEVVTEAQRTEDRRTDRDTDRQVDDPLNGQPLRRPSVRPSEFENYVSQVADKRVTRFGANLLVPAARDFTVPPTATVPASYRLNPGDELVVGLTGSINADQLHRTINADGQIFLPSVGAVTVAGVPYGDVQSVIADRVARQYRDARVSVSIGRLHGITVYVTGFAATPGSYTVSSLSTLVNAVLAAGGPSSGGSFRSIQVRRQGRLVSDFDLYDLLLKGDKRADVVLQNDDVIYIAPAGAQVAVIGSANNEAIFEARGRDTLNDILLYAGGVNTVADETRLLLLDSITSRSGAQGWTLLSPADVRTRVAQRGQVIRVLSDLGIARPLEQQPVLVTVSGEVGKPGRYYVAPGTPVSAILVQAGGLTRGAFPFGTVFTRERVRQQQQQSFDRAVSDTNIALTAEPVTDALATGGVDAGRLSAIRDVIGQLEVRRPDGRLVLDLAPDAATIPGDMVLENNDTLYVPPRPVSVGVFGSVPSPSSFRFRSGARIGDYLKDAGGVQKYGDRSNIFVVRANGSLLAPRHGLFKGSILNQPALPGDLVYVPVDASRGLFFAKLRTVLGPLSAAALTATAVAR